MRYQYHLTAAVAVLAMLSAAGSTATGTSKTARDQETGSSQGITPDAIYRRSDALRNRLLHRLPEFLEGREVRSVDGSGNNKTMPDSGAAFSQLQRLGGYAYSDGISGMGGTLRKSPREISNIVVAQGDNSYPNPFGTSDFLWQWGQFIDHDIALTDGVLDEGPTGRDFDITVPAGDPYFDPYWSGAKTIEFNRGLHDPETGTDLANPRTQQNELTSWIDGSQVYGSDEVRAMALRTLDGTGRLKTSPGDLLPFNIDALPNAQGMPVDPTTLFLAGDVRSNEQVGLTSMHTLFVREHNRRADFIRRTRPWYSDEQIYQAARRIVAAEIQWITYNEFLPALIGKNAIRRYRGYKPANATLFAEFSGAAYRMGHTLINPRLMRLDRRGREISEGHLPLRDVFFRAPEILKEHGDVDPILRGLASQKSQTFDCKIVDDLRNFLFGPPGAGGFDLSSLNMQRGRDFGLYSYNDMREVMGLGRVSDFDEISSDPAVQQALYDAYGSVDDIDLWVGGICEDAMAREGSQLGPLFRSILAAQFTRLRDADRFWYERDLTRPEIIAVEHMTLAKIIRANTGVGYELQDNVFYVEKDDPWSFWDKRRGPPWRSPW